MLGPEEVMDTANSYSSRFVLLAWEIIVKDIGVTCPFVLDALVALPPRGAKKLGEFQDLFPVLRWRRLRDQG